MKMTCKAAAKINLLLDIADLFPNGYHSLYMVMQSLDLFDEITVETTVTKKIELTCSEPFLPADERNIAFKAAVSFFEYTGIKNPGVKIHVEKNIPFAAGLAGGSADGAGVIFLLDKIFDTKLKRQALIELGLSVGSDVPFCLIGGTCLVENFGDVIAELKPLPPVYFVLCKPEQSVSTKDAFRAYDEFSWIYRPQKARFLNLVQNGDIKEIAKSLANVFEQVIEVPERVNIKTIMRKHGALGSVMSGSGPTVFGMFSEIETAKSCAKELKKKYSDVFVCSNVKSGCMNL